MNFGDGQQLFGLLLLVSKKASCNLSIPWKKFIVCKDMGHERYKVVRKHHQDY